MKEEISYPADIEGLWTFIYYSYSTKEKRAVGFINFGDDVYKKIVHNVVHPKITYLKLTIGGKDDDRYPGFNGLF